MVLKSNSIFVLNSVLCTCKQTEHVHVLNFSNKHYSFEGSFIRVFGIRENNRSSKMVFLASLNYFFPALLGVSPYVSGLFPFPVFAGCVTGFGSGRGTIITCCAVVTACMIC